MNNIELAKEAERLVAQGGTYQQRDCQAFVELALSRGGITRNWRGSNDMIRNMVRDVKPLDSNIQIGDVVFWVRHKGKEPQRYKPGGAGYVKAFDGWDASHVGIYVGNGKVAESGMGIGVWAITDMRQRGVTHYGKHKNIVYTKETADNATVSEKSKLDDKIMEIEERLAKIENKLGMGVG